MNSLYGTFRQLYFSHVFKDVEEWNSKLAETHIDIPLTEHNKELLYYLLVSQYSNSTIASSDINRFVFSVARIIFQYGPTWEKRLEIQKNLRELTDEEIKTGSTDIYNHAYNPSQRPTTQATEELSYINEQTVTKRKKGPLDAYAYIWDLLDTDVTGEFLDKFKKLFLVIVQPEKPLLYLTKGEQNNE